MLNKEYRNRKSWLASIILVASLSLVFISRLEAYISLGPYILMALSFVCLCLFLSQLNKNKIFVKFLKTLLFFVAALIFNFVFIRNFEIKQLIFGALICPSIACLLFFYDYKQWVTWIPFCITLSLIIYRWFILGMDAEGVTTNSRNYIIYLLLLTSFPYIVYSYRCNKKPMILLPITLLVLSILAIGRGGIIMACIFFIGWIVGGVRFSKHKCLSIFLLLICISLIGYFLYGNDTTELLFSRFEERGLESDSRTDAWKQYIHSLTDPFNFIFGTRVSTLPLVHALDDSLHNSYLQLHARMGLAGIPYLFMALSGFMVLLKRKEYVMVGYFGAFLVKGLVDADFPCTLVGGDIYMYYLILISIENSYNKRVETIKNEGKSNSFISAPVPSDSGE